MSPGEQIAGTVFFVIYLVVLPFAAAPLFRLLERLLGEEPLSVNSYHHQAVRTPAPGFTVTATAADGVVEGVEAPGRNLYAVQWHPEDLVERHPRFRPLFRHLVEQAERFAER